MKSKFLAQVVLCLLAVFVLAWPIAAQQPDRLDRIEDKIDKLGAKIDKLLAAKATPEASTAVNACPNGTCPVPATTGLTMGPSFQPQACASCAGTYSPGYSTNTVSYGGSGPGPLWGLFHPLQAIRARRGCQ